jgi:hypothetical protein
MVKPSNNRTAAGYIAVAVWHLLTTFHPRSFSLIASCVGLKNLFYQKKDESRITPNAHSSWELYEFLQTAK